MTIPAKELQARLQGLKGSIVAMTTPFNQDLSLDIEGLKTYTQYLVDTGVEMVIAAGSTGEFISLTDDERIEVIKTVAETANGRMTVIGGCAHSGTEIAKTLVGRARDVGADGVMVTPPYYQFDGHKGLMAHYEAISSAHDIGIVLYISGAVVKLMSSYISNVANLTEVFDIPNVVAIKDSVQDYKFLRDLSIAHRDRVAIMASGGMGYYLWGQYFGTHCTLAGLGNFYPAWEQEVLGMIREGKHAEAAAEIERVEIPYLHLCAKMPGYFPMVKGFMDLIGLPGGPMRPPMITINDEQRKLIKDFARQAGLLDKMMLKA